MINRQYVCNFCRANKPVEGVVGLSWIGATELEKKPAYEVENHLCTTCWRALGALLVVDHVKDKGAT